MKKAVFLYDKTGLMAKPWADAGFLCFCFDGQHPAGVSIATDNILNVGMWFEPSKSDQHIADIKVVVGDEVAIVFGFPECTDLAVSGAAHFAAKLVKNPQFQTNAVALCLLVKQVGEALRCPWALENPVSVLSTRWRKPNFIFHPWEFGGYLPVNDVHPLYPEYIKPRDAYPKRTCIWAGDGFKEPPRRPVPCDDGYSAQHKKLGGKSLKTKNIRSATPRGFAIAVMKANK